MIAEILSTGDEVLLGDIVDTNSSWLCRKMTKLGIRTARITAVGDAAESIAKAIAAIAPRAETCIVTGGLGPTQDDVTALGCADAAGTTLAQNAEALGSMKHYFNLRGWQLSPENEKQALLPRGAGVLENRHGTAPGFEMQIQNCSFYFLPGVPEEMKQMFVTQVAPKLTEKTGGCDAVLIRRLMVFGLSESVVGSRLTDFDGLYPGILLGFRARFPLIEVKLVKAVTGNTGTESGKTGARDPELEAAVRWTADRLGRKVVSFEGLTLEQEVGRLLTASGQTLSVAESCTGGLISHKITDVAGASDYFLFTGVTYANFAKTKILGVSQKTLDTCGAVHEETARQMAAGAKIAGGSDWAVATTGIAGPSGGTIDKPVGTVCIGVAGPDKVLARRFVLDTGDRKKNKQLFAAAALEMLRRELSDIS